MRLPVLRVSRVEGVREVGRLRLELELPEALFALLVRQDTPLFLEGGKLVSDIQALPEEHVLRVLVAAPEEQEGPVSIRAVPVSDLRQYLWVDEQTVSPVLLGTFQLESSGAAFFGIELEAREGHQCLLRALGAGPPADLWRLLTERLPLSVRSSGEEGAQ